MPSTKIFIFKILFSLIKSLFGQIKTDGLKDCEDPECCEQDVCSGKQLCTFVEDPRDLLKNITEREGTIKTRSSFWERIKFLVAENGIQRYVVESLIEERYKLNKIILCF